MFDYKKYLRFVLPVSLILVITIGLMLNASSSRNLKPIIFDHNLHIDQAGMTCAECHIGIEGLSAGQRAMPDHNVCESCHDVSDANMCATCHRNPDNPMAMPSPSEFYSAFEHAVHTEAAVSCETCHGNLMTSGASPVIPKMSDCQQCHTQTKGPLTCEACHDGKRPLPSTHLLTTWNTDHGMDARLAGTDCASCHTQQSCDMCHQGINISGSPHPPTWKFNHFAETSFGSECLSCHQTRSYCTDCHKSTRPVPHPIGSGFANRQTGGDHKQDFAMFTESCLSCHDLGSARNTCNRCHN